MAALRALSARQAPDRLAGGVAYDGAAGLVVADALGRAVKPDSYSARFRALCVDAGVPVIRLHAVRHTVGLILYRAGVAPVDAAALHGHTLATHYAHHLPRTRGGVESAGGRLGEVLAAVR